jgi:hypothetical protein
MITDCINYGVKRTDEKGIIYKNRYIEVVLSLDKKDVITVKLNKKVQRTVKAWARSYGTSERFALWHYFNARGII